MVKKGFDKEDGEQQQQLSLPPPRPGESERGRGDWENTRIGTGTGYMVSTFGGWGKEPDGRRLTRQWRGVRPGDPCYESPRINED